MLMAVFEKVLSMSLLGSYIICVVFPVRLLLHKCERKYAYFLWLVVFLNLCLPISINSPFSLIPNRIMTVVEELTDNGKSDRTVSVAGEMVKDSAKAEGVISDLVAQNIGGGTGIGNADSAAETQRNVGAAVADSREEGNETAKGQHAQAFYVRIFSGVWLGGLVIIAGISMAGYLRLRKQLKNTVDKKEGVLYLKGIESPFLWGFLKPVIYLPANIEKTEVEYIVAHESYHKKRGDHIVKPLVFAVTAVHWFNPLVWVAYVFFIRDMEISCDEAVLSHAGRNIKKEYAGSLLKYAAKQNGFVMLPLTFGEPSLKSRIQNVLKFKKRGMVVTVLAVGVVALTACGLVLRPQSGEALEQEGQQSETGERILEAELTGNEGTGDGGLAGGEIVGNQEETHAREDLPAYFQALLENGENTALKRRDEGLRHVYSDNAGEYCDAYCAILDISEETDYLFSIRWMKLSEELILEDWEISLQKELEGKTTQATLVGVFYDETQEKVYMPISAITEDIVWVLAFSVKHPEDIEIYEYPGVSGAWFGVLAKIGNCLYLEGGSYSVPYEINLETMEGRSCQEEYEAAKNAMAGFAEAYEAQTGLKTYLCWFSVTAGFGDITLFTGSIRETMDMPIVAWVYVAAHDAEPVETMLVEEESGKVVY